MCISGKSHKFGHKKCAEGVRREFLPGVCIHSDHSGPYAKSLSGARYSQLYLDRGSGYLWSSIQKTKTEHYKSTPTISIDSWAISGRKVQVFQTDGDGVFASNETRDLEAEKVVVVTPLPLNPTITFAVDGKPLPFGRTREDW